MQHHPSRRDAAAPIDRAIFRIQLRSGVWSVKLGDRFYGDYSALHGALESVGEKARKMRTEGRSVHILTLSASGAILTSKVLGPQ